MTVSLYFEDFIFEKKKKRFDWMEIFWIYDNKTSKSLTQKKWLFSFLLLKSKLLAVWKLSEQKVSLIQKMVLPGV